MACFVNATLLFRFDFFLDLDSRMPHLWGVVCTACVCPESGRVEPMTRTSARGVVPTTSWPFAVFAATDRRRADAAVAALNAHVDADEDADPADFDFSAFFADVALADYQASTADVHLRSLRRWRLVAIPHEPCTCICIHTLRDETEEPAWIVRACDPRAPLCWHARLGTFYGSPSAMQVINPRVCPWLV